MIAIIRGTLLQKSPTEIIVDIGGVGYHLLIPLTTFDKLPEAGETVTLFTHLHVREDALQLYGFIDSRHKDLFKLLITVTGIGPKVAQSILSGQKYDDIIDAIQRKDIETLSKAPGIGRKTAERLVMELKDKLPTIETFEEKEERVKTPEGIQSEALSALTTLGYSRSIAERAIRDATHEANSDKITLEELIKISLRHISS